jgi:hypothetical protein
MPDATPQTKLSAATQAAQLLGYVVTIAPCTSPHFPNTTEVCVFSDKFSAPELAPNLLLRDQSDGRDEVFALLVAKLAQRCGKFQGGGP